VKPVRGGKRGTARRRGRRTAAVVTGVVTMTSIAGYVALSFTVNGLPTYPPAGWIAVLQPATAPNADIVQLLVQARTQGGQTRAAYDVVVCGPQPYTGDLLIGGSAQLTATQPDPLLPSSQAPRIQRIPDLVFYFGSVIDLGTVHLVRISLPDVTACPPADAVQSAGILPGGSAEGITGVTSGPVQQSWAGPWGLWHGPHATQAWPLTGTFPGIPANVLGDYPAISGLSGSWSRPLQEYVKVTADAVPVTWSVDSAVPAASGPYPLTWQGRTPVSPVVRLTDNSSMALLQNWVIIFAVAFGIAGSLLASLLFEWLRRPYLDDTAVGEGRPPQRNPVPERAPAHPEAARARVPGGRLALAVTVIVIGYARSRLARSRHR